MTTKGEALFLIFGLVVSSSGHSVPVSDLEEHTTNRTIEDSGVFVYNCEVTKDLIQAENESVILQGCHASERNESALQVCVSIEPQYTQQEGRYQRLGSDFLREARKAIRMYTHGNESCGTLLKFRVMKGHDFKNRKEPDPEYVAVIPSGTIVFCSFGNFRTTCSNTFLNGSSPQRYVIETTPIVPSETATPIVPSEEPGTSAESVGISVQKVSGISASVFIAGLLIGSITVFLLMSVILWKEKQKLRRRGSN